MTKHISIMKSSSSLVLLFLVFAAAAQTHLPPSTDYLPNTLLNYDYMRDNDKNIVINDHYASNFLESNYQYQGYLRCLKAWGLDSLWQLAQPNEKVWETPSLNDTDIAYLKTHYWTSPEFEHYPVVGLGFEQIRTYLLWKTNMLNLAAYEAAGGTDGYAFRGVLWSKAKVADGFPVPFSWKEYRHEVPEPSQIFNAYPSFRLPTAQELFSQLPIPKKTKGSPPKQDKRFIAWLKMQPRFGFLTYEPPKPNKRPTDLQKKLETLGIRPVIESDLTKLGKRDDAANLPLVAWQSVLPKALYEEDFIYLCSEEDLEMKKGDPNFNPKNLKVIVFNPDEVAVVDWVSQKGRLITLSIHKASERPLFGFRAMMTKVD